MPKQPPPTPPELEPGDYCAAVYPGGRRYRARVTGKVGNHLIICHVSADGALVLDPDGTTRLFTADDLRSVAGRPGGLGPVATLEPEAKEARDAA